MVVVVEAVVAVVVAVVVGVFVLEYVPVHLQKDWLSAVGQVVALEVAEQWLSAVEALRLQLRSGKVLEEGWIELV